MKKNFLQDVVPANHKRSIRDIPLPKHRDGQSKPSKPVSEPARPAYVPEPEPTRAPEPAHSFENKEQVFDPQQLHSTAYSREEDVHQEVPEPTSSQQFRSSRPRGRSGKKVFTIFVLVGALVGALFIFGRTRAEVTLFPKTDTYEVDVHVPVNASSSIAVQTQITKTQSITLEATSEQQVEKQASGRIKIINNYEEAPQELVKNTRFQTPDGLIFRVKDSISIPGYKVVNGTTVPGTLEVEVYADSAGEEYNIGMTKFTIPGFSGMPQFDKITAESVTEMKGGFIGVKKVVSDDAEDDAYDELKAKLEAEFTSKAIISDTEVVVPDTETVVFGELTDEVNDNSVTLTLTATANAYKFAKQDLMNRIGQNAVIGSGVADTFSMNLDNLDFTKDSDTIVITGSTDITWETDIGALKGEVAGKKRSEIVQIMGAHQSVEKADIRLDPFWKTKFPSEPSKISVKIGE
jgi:hypothetical protein